MKRCPECRRDYYDDSLVYCLDDGAALLEGPTSQAHQTAILPGTDTDPTKVFDSENTAVLPTTSTGRKMNPILFVLIAVILLAGGGFAVYQYTRAKPPISFQSATLAKMTSTGKASGVAVSPDGKYLAYIHDDLGSQSLWVRQIATTSNVQLTQPAKVAYRGLTFTGDGSYVYYAVDEKGDQKGTLFQIPAIGGTPRKILEGIAGSVTFSPDGKRMAFFRTTSVTGHRQDALIISNIDGTQERVVTTRSGDERFYRSNFATPSWSLDGKSIACAIGNILDNQMTVATVSVDTGETRVLTAPQWFAIRQIQWLDGERILFNGNASPTSSYQMWQMFTKTGEVHRITNDLIHYRYFSLSRESNSIAVTQGSGFANLYIMPTGNLSQARQMTEGQSFDTSVSWTPDGRLVFASDASGAVDLFIKDSHGGVPKQLTVNAGSNSYVRVSRDGKYIVFMSDRTGRPCIWRMDADGGNAKRLTDGPDLFPEVTPDGQWVIYQSWMDGRNVLKKVPINGGQPVQLTDYPTGRPVISPDGKMVACTYTQDRTSPIHLAIIPVDGGQPLKIYPFDGFEAGEFLSRVDWSPDGDIVYAKTADGVSNLVAQPVSGGDLRPITNFTSDRIFWFEYSRDGKQLAVSRGQLRGDVVLITGFK